MRLGSDLGFRPIHPIGRLCQTPIQIAHNGEALIESVPVCCLDALLETLGTLAQRIEEADGTKMERGGVPDDLADLRTCGPADLRTCGLAFSPRTLKDREMRFFTSIFTAAALVVASAATWETAGANEISFVDLADDYYRQVLIDHESGQYLGHPTTCLLDDGKTILTVFPKGHGGGGIVYKRSTDGGLTWSERLPTPESWMTSKEVPTLHRVTDASGKKRIIMFSAQV